MLTVSTAVVLIVTLRCGATFAQTSAESDVVPPEVAYYDHENNGDLSPALDSELQQLSDLLVTVLEEPVSPGGVPLLYVEDYPVVEPSQGGGLTDTPWKRSRYYRRYPWKRQNSRSRTYEADSRYMCQPSREDVFKLLVALHETRAGNGGRSINFCNRRRSAGAIFTNIRFLGRRK